MIVSLKNDTGLFSQVPPAELESLLLQHPGVMDVAVVGLPDERAGELPLAFVVKKDPNVTEDELIKHVEGLWQHFV